MEVRDFADTLKGYVRTAVSYGEWPPLHYVKAQMEAWAWGIAGDVVKENPGNALYQDAYRRLTEMTDLRRRVLQYVR